MGYKISKARILKASTRIKDKAEAERILKELVEISQNHESIGDLFSKAMMKYLEESISKSLIERAKQNVEENRN